MNACRKNGTWTAATQWASENIVFTLSLKREAFADCIAASLTVNPLMLSEDGYSQFTLSLNEMPYAQHVVWSRRRPDGANTGRLVKANNAAARSICLGRLPSKNLCPLP